MDLIISSIKKRWDNIKNFTAIPLQKFISGINLIINSTFFVFNNKTYKQIFSTPMGSPLSPIIVDLVMQDIEREAMNRLSFTTPIYYRYVDDILLAVPRTEINNTVTIFNSLHDRMHFTLERSINNKINFLNVTIELTTDFNLIFNLCFKSTFSGRYLNFQSNHPLIHKRGIIFGLVDKVFKLSNSKYHQTNIENIIRISYLKMVIHSRSFLIILTTG